MAEGRGTGYDARILVIDDEPRLRQLTSRLLAGAGYQVVEASTGEEGFRLIRETKPDLILLDVMLPDMNGLQLCRRIKADTELADTFVVLLSGKRVDSDNRSEGLEEGADDYILRPIANRELLARVGAMLRLQRAEKMRRAQMQELRERVKELNCLYGISELIERADLSLPEILQGTVELIPPAWQHPDIACARIILGGQTFQTKGFRATAWKQSRDIRVHGGPAGRLEVCYLEQRLKGDESPFLKEERSLLNAIAERLGRIVERIRAEQARSESEQKFRALFQGMPVPVYTWQRSGEDFVLVDHNEAAEAITGGQISSFLGIKATAMYRDRPGIVKDISRCFAEKVSIQKEMAYRFLTTAEQKSLMVKYAFVPPDLVLVHTEDITQRKRAEAQLEEAAAAAERERLARDLHDAVTQSLFSVAAIAEALPHVWERDPQEARRGLEELRWLTQGALAEMRALLLELRPAALMEQKLGTLLRQLTDAMMGRTRMPVTTTVVGDCLLPADVQIALYRIAQEALNNITKHARAGQAKVSLHCEPAQARLRVSDDGLGFDPDAAQAHHLGLEIMRERARAIGATLSIESRAGHGTRIEVNWYGAGEGQDDG